MKKVIILYIIISFLALGCSKKDDISLEFLRLSTGDLIPKFHPDTLVYEITGLNSLRPIKIEAKTSNEYAIIKINGNKLSPDSTFVINELKKDAFLNISVIAESGSIRNYKIKLIPKDFPNIKVKVKNNPAPGYIFLSNFKLDLQFKPYIGRYLLILNNNGEPVFYKKVKFGAADFTKQENGMYSYFIPDHFKLPEIFGHFEILDSNFNLIKIFKSKKGFTDLHEFIIDTNNHITYLGVKIDTIDLTSIGGKKNTIIWDYFIEQTDFDSKQLFYWESFENYKVTDIISHYDLTVPYIEHGANCNSISFDEKGNYILSSRKLDEITKIDKISGEIIWRMGGVNCKNNQFKFINDRYNGFSHQHSAIILENKNLLVFDNGNFRTKDIIDGNIFKIPNSRVCEYKIDETKKIAYLVWEYLEVGVFAPIMGNCQRLKNGNTFICWSIPNPVISEISPNGEKVLEMEFVDGFNSYTGFKFEINK